MLNNKTGLQPVSRPVEYWGVGVSAKSLVVKAGQTDRHLQGKKKFGGQNTQLFDM